MKGSRLLGRGVILLSLLASNIADATSVANEQDLTDVTAAIHSDVIVVGVVSGVAETQVGTVCDPTCHLDVYEYQEIEIINTYYGEIEHAAIFVRSANLLPGGRFVLPLFRDPSFDTSTAPPTDTRLFVVSYSQYFPGETDESLALSLSYVRTLRELLNVSPTAALESVGG